VHQDSSDHHASTRAALEEKLRVLEAKRDALQAELESQHAGGTRPARKEEQASRDSILQVLEGTLQAVQPVLGMMTSAHEMLLTEHVEAQSRNDSAGALEAAKMLDELNVQFDELRASVAQIEVAAARVRTMLNAERPDDSK
jgi:hypothetical protein